MTFYEFLRAELDYAGLQLQHVRRRAARMRERLAGEGLDEVAVCESLATSKAYRLLIRDDVTYRQMWLRAAPRLERLPPAHRPLPPSRDLLAHLPPGAQFDPHAEPDSPAFAAGRNVIPFRSPPPRHDAIPGRVAAACAGYDSRHDACAEPPAAALSRVSGRGDVRT